MSAFLITWSLNPTSASHDSSHAKNNSLSRHCLGGFRLLPERFEFGHLHLLRQLDHLKKKTQNLTKMELYLMWYGTVGVYLEQNGINMEGWYQVGTFGRTNIEEIMPTNPGGSVVSFFEWGISREKTARLLLSIRLNSDHFPAWKLTTYLCYVTIICISIDLYTTVH